MINKKNLNIKTVISILCCVALVLSMAGCKKEEPEPVEEAPSSDNYSTYAFFGSDSRMAGEDWKTDTTTGTQGVPSSDVIMLLSINEDTGEARISSVYRDTMLDVGGEGSDLQKCNVAFQRGGAYGAMDMLERNLDTEIRGYVTANFMTVADAIDMLGGIEVDIEDQETNSDKNKEKGLYDVVDTANKYIDEMNRLYGTDTPHIEHAGRQTLSGLQAVAYSRVRYTDGGDMRRAQRQRNVVALMAEKLKSADADTQRSVLKQMYQEVDTDLSEEELMDLFDHLIGYDLDDLGGFPYKMGNYIDEEKGDMLVPCDLVTNVKELHAFRYGEEDYEPSETVKEYDRLIKEETGLEAKDAIEALSSY